MKRSLLLIAVLLVVGLANFAHGEEAEVAKETAASTKQVTSQGTAADRQKLVQHLFKDYKKTVNPDNLNVKFGVAIINFHVCDKNQVLESSVWLRYVWKDERLAWDIKEHPVDVLRYDSNEVWKPDITLFNSADPVTMMSCWDSNVLLYPNGEVLWVPPCTLTSHCKLNLKREPYGEQTCSMKFGSWTFDGNNMDLNFYNNITTFDLSDMSNTSGFEIVSTTGEKHSRTYPCCEEPYLDIQFNMTIKRVPGEELRELQEKIRPWTHYQSI